MVHSYIRNNHFAFILTNGFIITDFRLFIFGLKKAKKKPFFENLSLPIDNFVKPMYNKSVSVLYRISELLSILYYGFSHYWII